jgi:heptosyltransferase-2
MTQPGTSQLRILIRGVNWLGDAVMTTPALQRLRQALPGAHLTLLTSRNLAGLWQQHPSLDNILTFSPGESPWAVARRLRPGGFQTALVLPNSPRSALEPWLAGIPERIGFAHPWRNWLLTRLVVPRAGHRETRKRSPREIRLLVRAQPTPGVSRVGLESEDGHSLGHQIHDYLHLAAALGANPEPIPPLLSVSDGEIREAVQKFGLPNTSSAPRILGVAPGAQYGPAKRWPLERFIAVTREINNRTGCHWLLLGGEGDKPAADELASALSKGTASPARASNLAGRTSLRELCALLKLCQVLLTNDSGPMHVAAALGTPVVALFGSTSPELTGPGLPGDTRHRVLRCPAPCSPCFRRTCPIDFRCMTGLGVEQTTAAVLELNRR